MLFCPLSPLMNLLSLSWLVSRPRPRGFIFSFHFPHASPSHFTGQLPFPCRFHDGIPCSLSHFLTTSHVGSSEQSSASPRVRDQSEALISPTTTTVDAAGQKEGSELTSCHTDPASQGQNPGPWATVSHCVSFQLLHSHGATGERAGDSQREGDHRERERERKRAPTGPGDLFVTCEQ